MVVGCGCAVRVELSPLEQSLGFLFFSCCHRQNNSTQSRATPQAKKRTHKFRQSGTHTYKHHARHGGYNSDALWSIVVSCGVGSDRSVRVRVHLTSPSPSPSLRRCATRGKETSEHRWYWCPSNLCLCVCLCRILVRIRVCSSRVASRPH